VGGELTKATSRLACKTKGLRRRTGSAHPTQKLKSARRDIGYRGKMEEGYLPTAHQKGNKELLIRIDMGSRIYNRAKK